MIDNKLFQKFLAFTISVYDATDETRNNIKPDSVTALQYRIMEALYLDGDNNVTKLCACLGISLPNTSREVRKLTQLGYITKTLDPSDGRKYNLNLTQLGMEIMNISFKKIENDFNKKADKLSSKEQEELISYMDIVSKKLF